MQPTTALQTWEHLKARYDAIDAVRATFEQIANDYPSKRVHAEQIIQQDTTVLCGLAQDMNVLEKQFALPLLYAAGVVEEVTK